MPADELGEAGEALFRSLCARARLVCNKSDRDRSGWDFIVDLPIGETSALLDQRQKTSCHVQLKTTAAIGSGSVSLRLSSADLLAKDPHPALIAVFRMRADGEPIRGYLIHLVDQPLAKLLRRLRQAEARGRRNTNNLKISFDYRRHGRPFALTPAGLLGSLEAACGPDPAAYATEKIRQLAELGYEDGQFSANALFHVEDDEHFTRVLLGLEPIEPLQLRAFDTRFGIPIPYTGDAFGALEEIMLVPPSVGICSVAITGPPMCPAARFTADLQFAPPFDANLRMVIKHPDFTFLFRETAIAFESNGVFTERARPLDELVMVLRALTNLASGQGGLVVTGDGGSFGPLRFPMQTALTGPYVDQLPRLWRLATDWATMLEMAGVTSSRPLRIEDLWESRKVQLAADLLLRDEPTARFSFDADALQADASEVRALFFDSAFLAADGIAYCVEITLTPSLRRAGVFVASGFRPVEVRPAVSDLDEYMDELIARFGPTVLVHPDSVREVDPELLEERDADKGSAERPVGTEDS